MSKTANEETQQLPEFDLRHRVTGAAVLLFLGALVLPWLLGPPSAASKVEVAHPVPATTEVEVANIMTSARGSEPLVTLDEIEETVYISKITPLDAKGNSDLVRAANEAAASTKVREKEQPEEDALVELVKEQNAALEKAAVENLSTEIAAKDSASKLVRKAAPKEIATLTPDQQQAKNEKDLQAALAAELKSQTQKAEDAEKASLKNTATGVGWVVQVGLFTDKSRAIALISELKKKGFMASSSVVDTNRGKKTGTRVWLGPFAKRVAAINQQKRLKSKAGKEGFIRVYP
ncbi:MAG: cell division septation protein DedD [Arenicella sp.]|jgi:cell division septation protein DedD